ncbi:MAG: alpha/beta hydrolase [Chloroflexi bacterium]|nr:alpha/beta hydrolase [Chloroflexota bacterium]
MHDWPNFHLDVNGTTLRVIRSHPATGDRPQVVLVHGFTDDAMYWTRTAEILAQTYEVIAYDARGHGESARRNGTFDDVVRAADLLAVIDALKLDRPLAIGHSMGGSTIANAAALRPTVFRAIALEDPAWWETADIPAEQRAAAEAGMRTRTSEWRRWLLEVQSADDAQSLTMVHEGNPIWSHDDAVLSRNARQRFDPAMFEDYPPAAAPWRSAVAAWRCPALLLLGSERNAIITPQRAEEARSINASVRWTQITGAGHAIRYDRFDDYIGAVLHFLAVNAG